MSENACDIGFGQRGGGRNGGIVERLKDTGGLDVLVAARQASVDGIGRWHGHVQRQFVMGEHLVER